MTKEPESARREAVTKTVGGITFDDPYAWLQSDSEEALAWQWRQDQLAQDDARSWHGFEPLRRAIRAQLGPRLEMYARPRVRGGRFFRLRTNEAGTGATLTVADGVWGEERLLLDSATLDEDEERATNILFMEPSPDGARVAVGLAVAGQPVGDWRIVDVVTGRLLDERAADVHLMNCAQPGWLPDASGFWINDRTAESRHRIRFIALDGAAGQPERVLSDAEIPPLVPGLSVQVSPGGRYAVIVTEPHQRCTLHILDLTTGDWRRFLPEGFDGECHGGWLDDDTYVAVTTHDTDRGRVVAIPVASSADPTTWRELVPEAEAVIRAVTVIRGRVVTAEMVDVSLRIRVFGPEGTPESEVPLEPFGMSHLILVPRRIEATEELVFPYASFVQRTSWLHYDLETGRLSTVGTPGEKLDGIEVVQRFASTEDGTSVPYFMIHRTDVDLTTTKPTLINAYGGFSAAWLPFPLEHAVPFIEAGGVWVHANLRGGGEYGRRWHEAGKLDRIQTSFDDLYAVAEDLIAAGITTSDELAFQGHSHGGLLAGVAIVQRPDLWKVVCPTSPLLDMMEPVAPGPAASSIQTYYLQHYGDPADPQVAPRILTYSPYHSVRDDVAYPAVYQVFGENDLACAPFHGRKFTARLQAATSSGLPVRLRVWRNVGHGALDLDTAAEQSAEWLGFVMQHLGMAPEWTSTSAPTLAGGDPK